MSQSFAAFAYLISGVLFILALRGLSHPTSSRRGNLYGMIGMGIAVVTTLLVATPTFGGLVLIILGITIGGGAGAIIAKRIPMTSPLLVWQLSLWPPLHFIRPWLLVLVTWVQSTLKRLSKWRLVLLLVPLHSQVQLSRS
jgi:hypothetical protein